MFMKKEAVGLARCVVKMRDNHFRNVCSLQDRSYSLQASRNSEVRALYMIRSQPAALPWISITPRRGRILKQKRKLVSSV